MSADALFKSKAPEIMRLLMADFGLSAVEAAAICGNLGHESGGFKFLQELKPIIPGSKGGTGWAQWTGPRRREFEAYCRRNNKDPASDDANYGFLFVELTGPEKKAIPAVKKAGSLRDKVVAFEAAFERAGIKHYDSRVKWAEKALAAYNVAPQPAEPATPIPPPPDVPPPVLKPPSKPDRTSNFWAGIFAVLAAGIAALVGIIVEYLK